MSWEIAERDLKPVATGAAVLGTGGGGNPYLGLLRMRELLRAGRSVRVIDREELADDALVVAAGGMGAPVVNWEKLPAGDEEAEAVRALEEHLGRTVEAIAPLEMGGSNSLVALTVGAQLGVPVLDGDGMGRAFPELQMVTYLIYGGSPAPAALADEKGNRTVLTRVAGVHALEAIARAVTIEYGGHAGLAMCVMSGAHARATCVPGTLTLARRIGEAIEAARSSGRDPVEAVLAVTGGRRLARGKIVDVDRRLVRGFARGRVTLEGYDGAAGGRLSVEFQNENLIVRRGEEPVAVVPDLIVLLDADSGEPLTTEVLRYGFRVELLVLPPSPVLTTPEALRFVGPRAFGYDVDYRPAHGMRTPRDVVQELVDAYNAKALDRLVALYAADASYWDPFHRDGLTGRDAIGGVLRDLFERLPDERMAIAALAADETHAVAEFRSTGTSASGRPYELEFTEVYEVRDGQIASCYVYIDPEQIPA